MTTTGEQTCPHCGNVVPAEAGQHADNLLSGTLDCPHCGKSLDLREAADDEASGDVEGADAAPPGRSEGANSSTLSETPEDLAEELRNKPSS